MDDLKILEKVKLSKVLEKYLKNKEIKKKFFVKNKLVNIII